MSNLYKLFGTDKDIEKNGVWCDYGDTRIRVARTGGGNKKYLRAIEVFHRKYKRQLEVGTLKDAVAEKCLVDVYARTIITEWEGVTDENENPLECNYANIVKLLTDLPDLFADIRAMSSELELYKTEINEDLAGN